LGFQRPPFLISALPHDLGNHLYSIVKERRYYTRLSRLSIQSSTNSASDCPIPTPYPGIPLHPRSSQNGVGF
jgi:hypothetical protein